MTPEKTVLAELGEIKTQIALNGQSIDNLKESFEDHEGKFDELDKKVDDLMLSVARRNGALEENRRHARQQGALSGGLVSICVALISAGAVVVASGACFGMG
jgi:hypothetical protein